MKDRKISFNISELEYQKLRAAVEKNSLSQSEIMRMGMWMFFDRYLPEKEMETDVFSYLIDKSVEKALKERGL